MGYVCVYLSAADEMKRRERGVTLKVTAVSFCSFSLSLCALRGWTDGRMDGGHGHHQREVKLGVEINWSTKNKSRSVQGNTSHNATPGATEKMSPGVWGGSGAQETITQPIRK